MSKSLISIMVVFFFSSHFAKGSGHQESSGVAPEKSLQWLQNGNTRYVTQRLRKDGQSPSDRTRLSSGQKPHAIILSCSDSRVPPEVIFDQKLGEIFVVRTAGEALGDNVVGSIEYAVEHLGSQLILVMGHTSCGAVKAALGTMNGSSAGTPALDGLVKDMHPRLRKFKNKEPSKHVHVESFENARQVANDLKKRSKLLSERIDAGKLRIVSSLYELDTGRVLFETKPKKEIKIRTPASEKKSHIDHHETRH